jgi:hypothetical protein
MSAKTNGDPSERDRFWLDHQAAQRSSGQTAKEYAAAQDLSLHAFYQARKRLRALGLLDPAELQPRARRSESKSEKVSFSKIAVASAPSEAWFRLELPGAMALEWDGGEVPGTVVSLLERLTPRP